MEVLIEQGVEWFQSNSVVGSLIVLLWIALVLYGASALWWVFEVAVLGRGWRPETTAGEFHWKLDDIQVRVLTVGAEDVVQGTVDSIPDGLTDVKVIAEKGISIDGASVHVVPESFT